MVIFYGFDPFFTEWGPISPKMDPRGSPQWFGAITVTSIFCEKSNFDQRGSQKFEFGAFLLFLPNGAPLALRWTLGGPHSDLAP